MSGARPNGGCWRNSQGGLLASCPGFPIWQSRQSPLPLLRPQAPAPREVCLACFSESPLPSAATLPLPLSLPHIKPHPSRGTHPSLSFPQHIHHHLLFFHISTNAHHHVSDLTQIRSRRLLSSCTNNKLSMPSPSCYPAIFSRQIRVEPVCLPALAFRRIFLFSPGTGHCSRASSDSFLTVQPRESSSITMKYSVGLLMAVAAIGANAQSFADLPQCGVRPCPPIPRRGLC